jgi:hypothetical protein
MEKIEDNIKRFVNDNSYLEFDKIDGNVLVFYTRKNGSVGNEEASEIDIVEAKKIGRLLLKNFSKITVNIEEVDEWVHLNVINERNKIEEYNYKFIKHSESDLRSLRSSGFTSNFKSFDALLDRYRTWTPKADFDQINELLNKITEYPNRKCCGWFDSQPIMIAKPDENDFGYYFSIVKSKKI